MLSKSQAYILAIADQAYKSGEAFLMSSLADDRRNDALADFLSYELRNVAADANLTFAIESALHLLDQSIGQLEVVRRELDYARRRLR